MYDRTSVGALLAAALCCLAVSTACGPGEPERPPTPPPPQPELHG